MKPQPCTHPAHLLLLTLLAATLGVACAEEDDKMTAIVQVGADGTSSALVGILDEDIAQAEVDTHPNETFMLWDRHFTVAGVKPGDYTVEITLNGATGAFRLRDLRPQTTAILYLHRESKALRLTSHRRFSADFDDNGSNNWIVEDLGANPSPD